jgi:DNA-binding HxlR family transcriptional regulator
VVADVLSRIGDKWTVYVVRLLSDGSMRFNEIKRAIPAISQRMLTLTLRGLERDGLVTRTIYPTIPPRVDYELTDLGRTLITTLMAMGEWAVSNRAKVEKARAAFDAKEKKTKAKIGLARVMPLPWGRQN